MSAISPTPSIPTSPQLDVEPGIVTTQKEFSDNLTMDLTDDEIKKCLQLILPIKRRWNEKFRNKFTHDPRFDIDKAMKMVDEFEDELKTTLAEKANVLARVDITPLFEGQPMVIEWLGILPSHSTAKYGLDYEKKTAEVKKATDQGEAFLGQEKME